MEEQTEDSSNSDSLDKEKVSSKVVCESSLSLISSLLVTVLELELLADIPRIEVVSLAGSK